jgi:hypothetical protein
MHEPILNLACRGIQTGITPSSLVYRSVFNVSLPVNQGRNAEH